MPNAPSPIGLVADFAGSDSRPLSERGWIGVDRDSLDDAIRKAGTHLLLELPHCHSLRISSWADFHPDHIVERVPSLKALQYARAEISNPVAMRQHLEEAGAGTVLSGGAPRPTSSQAKPEGGPQPDDDDLLDSILGGTDAMPAVTPRNQSSFDKMVRAIVDESTAQTDFAQEDARRDAIDQELNRRVREIMQHKTFREVEANWAVVRRIVRAGDGVPVALFDLRLAELASDTAVTVDERALLSVMTKAIGPVDEAANFSFLLCGWDLADDDTGAAAARIMSAVALQLRASFVTDIAADAVLDGGLASSWKDRLVQDGVTNMACVYPKILTRPPYGEATEPAEDFPFEEYEGDGAAPAYVWGSAALCIGITLARVYDVGGPFGEIDSLPIHVFRETGAPSAVGPTAELLHESRIKDLNESGVTCLVGVTGGDSAHVVGLRSLSGERLLDL